MAPASTNFIGSSPGGQRKMEEDISKVGGNRPPCSNETKRHKEMENVALQSSLGQVEGEQQQQQQQQPRQEEAEEESRDGSEETVELTQTDHLNKRLLASFLEKINQPSFSFSFPDRLPRQLGSLPEDSNKMLEDW